ncbi:MAG: hypothetical protein RIC03_06990 [Cyclobacteriaceae bacterium]
MPARFDPIEVDFILNSKDVKYHTAQIEKAITGADATAQKSAQKVGETVERVYTKSSQQVANYAASVANASKAQLKQNVAVVAGKRRFDGLGNSINQLSREMPAFAVSASVGFLALSNNIPILADEINKLRARNIELTQSGQKAVPVWKQLVKGILGWQTAMSVGIMLVTIYGREIGAFFKKLFTGKKAIDKLITSQNALNKAFEDSSYKDAIGDITKLKANVALAKDGMIDAADVVDQYNESLGKAAGEAQTLADVEQSLIDNADAYIQMMLYKAAAMESISEASKLVAENQKAQQALEDQIQKKRDQKAELNKAPKTEDEYLAMLARNESYDASSFYGTDAERKKRLDGQISDLDDQIAKLDERQKKLAEKGNTVYANLLKKAAEIAKANGLDLFPDGQKTGGGSSVTSRRQALLDRLAALDQEYARKKLESDEAEIQALKDKFARIRELVERFNADPKNKGAQIAMGDVEGVENTALANLTTAQTNKRLAKWKADFDKEAAEQDAQYADLLLSLRTYEKERLDIIATYAATRQELIANGKINEAKVLYEQHQTELDALDDANVAKMKSYKDLFDTTIELTKDSARSIIANAEKLLDTQQMSEETKAKILREIAEIQQIIEQTDIEKALQLSEALGKLGQSLQQIGGLGGLGAALSGIAGGVGDLTTIFDSTSTDMEVISAGINGVVRMIDMLATAARQRKEAEEAYYRSMIGLQHEYNLGLIDQTRLQSILAESVFIKDYEGRMTDAFAAMTESSQAYQEALEALGGAQVKIGQRGAIDWGNVGTGAGAGAAIGAAVGSIVPVIGTAIGAIVGGVGGALAGLFGGQQNADVWGSLLGEYPELLEQTEDGVWQVNAALAESLIANNLLDDKGKQLVQNALDLQTAYQEAQQQLNDVISDLAGSLGSDLRNALVDAFEAGEDAAKSMASSVEKTLENVLSNMIYSQVFSEAFKTLSENMTASFGTGGDQSWLDDFAGFFDEATGLADQWQAAMEAAQEAGQDFGFDLFNGSGGNSGLTGAIRREMTEQTASELTGLFRATFDLEKRSFEVASMHYALDQRALDATMQMMGHTAAIRDNTYNTTEQLKQVVTEIRSMSKRIGNKPGSYDKGI